MVEHSDKRSERWRRSVRYGQRRLKRLSRTATLGGIFLSFLQVGTTGFGGGLAVIAQLRALVMQKRRWFTEHEFAEGLALAQSLPGSMAGNVAAYVGLRLRGWRGAAVAMAGLVLPSMLLMIVLAILYRHLRSLPDTEKLFHGLNAAVVALIGVTAWRIGRSTLARPWQWYIAVLSGLAVIFLNATVIEVVFAAGLTGIYIDSFAERRWQRWRRIRRLAAKRRAELTEAESRAFVGGFLTRAIADEHVRQAGVGLSPEERERIETTSAPARRPKRAEKVKERVRLWRRAKKGRGEGEVSESPNRGGADSGKGSGTVLRSVAAASSALLTAMPVLAKLALLLTVASIFLRIGAVTFGGGYVMVPLIESEVVHARGWLTHREFVEAFALGQITPGPVLVTATFIGYRVAGTLGALVATVSIFLPSLVLTIVAGSSLRRFRSNRQVQAFLRGVTPAVVGLLVAAAWSTGRAGIHTWVGLSIALLAAAALLRFRLNPFLVMLGAVALRFAFSLLWF
ncbi:MAG TPA: chromate transporter [Pyrinomonadaceae bacterium]